MGGLIAILALFFFLSPRKLTKQSFAPFNIPTAQRTVTYRQYFTYATKPETDLEEGEALEEYSGPSGTGRFLTVNGRIPTPSGGSIPMFSTRDLSIPGQIDKMLQPIEEAKEEPHFQDVAGRRSINLRLKPI